MAETLDRFFHLKERGTTVTTEIIAGITTFATMAYILAVNVNMLGVGGAGLDDGAVFVATALGSVIGTIAMALLANLPFALAPGMGLNAFFAYTVVIGMGKSPYFALSAVLAEGVIFIILSATKVREKIFDAIPTTLKSAVGAGIGLFIIFIGMQNSGIVVGGATLVEFSYIWSGASGFNPVVALALIGIIITVIMVVKKIKGALLIGIAITWILGIVAQLCGVYIVDPAASAYSLIPSALVSAPPSLAPTFGKAFEGFSQIFTDGKTFGEFVTVMFAFLFVDIFDTVGTLGGVASKANMLDKEGKLPKVGAALMADAIGTSAGAILGTSTVTTYVESAAGVQEGGRTGLTGVVVSILFLLSLFFSPIFLTIPAFATAAALIVVGLFMLEPLKNVDLSQLDELIPVGITLIAMPVFYSISMGLIFGVIFYIVAKAFSGKIKAISPLMWVLGAVFTIYLVFFA
jgi:AGZA family xanthine/uracil permease-like MFS transporter